MGPLVRELRYGPLMLRACDAAQGSYFHLHVQEPAQLFASLGREASRNGIIFSRLPLRLPALATDDRWLCQIRARRQPNGARRRTLSTRRFSFRWQQAVHEPRAPL